MGSNRATKQTTSLRGSWRVLLAAAMLGAFANTTASLAACRDAPGPGVDWTGCLKQRLMLDRRDLTGANFEGAKLSGSGFQSAKLSGANFELSELVRVSFHDADLSNTDFEKALASRADFSGANFTNARLSRAEFIRVDFSGSDLSGANMVKGDFLRNDFTGANLAGVDLTGANAPRAIFHEANLAGADFSRVFLYYARFEGTDLSQVKGLTQDQLDDSCGDENTTLPPGLTMPARWPCGED